MPSHFESGGVSEGIQANSDFQSFGQGRLGSKVQFGNSAQYEKSLQMIDQEEAELKFLKMKHRLQLEEEIKEIDRTFNSRNAEKYSAEKTQEDESRFHNVVRANSGKKDECKNLLFYDFARKRGSIELGQ